MKAKKRGNGEGSLLLRSTGMWEAKFSFFDRKTRKTKRYSVYARTQGEAIVKRKQKIDELNGLSGLNATQLTVGKWLDEWLLKYHRDIAVSTRKNYQTIMNCYIKPRIGDIPILELEWEDVQYMYNDIETTGRIKRIEGADNRVSKQTINTIETILNLCFNEAVRKKLMRENVAILATKTKGKDPVKRRALSDEELDSLYLALASHPLKLLFELYIETGVRRGEGLGLTWDKVNWESNSIWITESLADAKGKPVLGNVKTKASERMIKLSKEKMAELAEHKLKSDELQQQYGKEFNPDNLVFFNDIGRGYMPRYILSEFKSICASAGISGDICLHSLRHTHGTVLRRNGTPIEIIQRRLGHARAAITLDTYTHREDDDQIEAVDTFAKHREKLEKRRKQNPVAKS